MSDLPITVNDLRRDDEVVTYLRAANAMMNAFGYTEHGERHAGLVAHIAQNILTRLDYPPRQAELAAMAGLLHDAGNLIHRDGHTLAGALLAREILLRLKMPFDEIALVMGAIGNHEEPIGVVASPVVAAVIIADKADVHVSRVQNPDPKTFDIHDRVNYAVQRSFVRVDRDAKTITLELEIDTTISAVSEYFEIFLNRMLMCRRAAQFLGCQFALMINNNRLM
ncbi:MAG: HD domain-containing protein [Chloroflexi bacterium]|nr:HD domain-containing protein [Chloroflexota bacterium]